MDKLQWGNRKRLRCVKVKDKNSSASVNGKTDGGGGSVVVAKKRITSRYADNNNKEPLQHHNTSLPPLPLPNRIGRDLGMNRLNMNEVQKASTSLYSKKEDRYYTTRGSSVGFDDSSKMCGGAREEKKKFVWPKLKITLSSKEKEEDFMAMTGCKPPQRPKKRTKLIQKTLLLVSPGAWLSDLCQEWYEVREKKTSKKKPRGLKAMGSMESDSE